MRQTADKLYRLLFTALSLYLTALLLRFPAAAVEYASSGLALWLEKMVPTLLPFMILSGIMIRMHLTEGFVSLLHPLLHTLFGVSKNGSYTIVMGFLCGFPMGARIVGELCETGQLSREEGARLLYFCNNIGPIYFLSYVVPALAIDKPLLPFLIMYGVPLVYGFILCRILPLFRRLLSPPVRRRRLAGIAQAAPMGAVSEEKTTRVPTNAAAPMPFPAAVDAAVLSGLIGIARLGGYMIFFNLLSIVFLPFPHAGDTVLHIFRCLLEITSGIDCSGQSLFYPILILLPFGGFSCIAQTYSMISRTDLSLRPYVFHKVMQTLLTALCYLAFRAVC